LRSLTAIFVFTICLLNDFFFPPLIRCSLRSRLCLCSAKFLYRMGSAYRLHRRTCYTKKEPPRRISEVLKVAATSSPTIYRSAVPSAMLPSPLSLPRPRAAGAHTAARPAPLMHFSQPNDHPSLMGIAKECVNARPWGPQNISNFGGERRHELLLRFSGVVSSLQSRCRPRHLWSL